jgi:hypothetical protein
MAEGPDHEKLTAFFRELTPAARAKLALAMNSEAGAGIPFRAVILEPLIAAQRALGEIPEQVSPQELLLAPLAPFVIPEDIRTKTRGVVTKKSRDRIVHWLTTNGAPELVKELETKLEGVTDRAVQDDIVGKAQDKLAQHLADVLAKAESSKARNRLAAQLGGDQGAGDLDDIVVVLRRRALLAKFGAEMHSPSGTIDEVLKTVKAQLDSLAIKYQDALSFALVLVRQKLPNPQTFVRLAAVAVESTDGARICETPYVRILDLALSEAEREYASARQNTSTAERGKFLRSVRGFGSTARALSTEIDLQADGTHARSLAALRREMAESVRSDLQDLAPRVRRLVRPRGQERSLEEHEVARLAADLDLLLIARSYAEEIALNALSSRVFLEVRDLLDTGTPQLMERLRAADEKTKPALRARLATVVDVSAKIFGSEYAALMSKAIDVAGQEARAAPQLRTA